MSEFNEKRDPAADSKPVVLTEKILKETDLIDSTSENTSANDSPLNDLPAKKSGSRIFRLIKKTFLITVAILSVVTAVFLWIFTRSVPVTVSKETTVLTEPLTESGSVDYFNWLRRQYPREMQTDQNGARDILRAIGPGSDYQTAPSEEATQKRISFLCSELNVEQPVKPLFAFEPFQEAHARLFKEKNPNFSKEVVDDLAAKNRPRFGTGGFGKFIQHEEKFTDHWVEKNSPALDHIAKMIDRKIIRYPYNKMFEGDQENDQPLITMLLPDLPRMRSLCRAYSLRANWLIRRGDFKKAASDFKTIRKMAAALEKQDKACLVEFLVGAAEEQIAFSIPFGSNPNIQPDRDLLLTLKTDLFENRPRLDWRRSLEMERIICLDFICRLARGDTRYLDKKFGSTLFLFPGYDWNIVLKEYNTQFDQYAKNPSSFPLEHLVYDSPGLDFLTRSGRSKWLARYFIGLLSPNQKIICERLEHISDLRSMMEIWIALELYRMDHGSWPPAFSVDANGVPLHNWRVLLLPYLGQEDLYRKIRLNEPWDSPHNCQFHHEGILAQFAVILSENGLFNRSGKGSVPDPKNTKYVLTMREDTSVCWMKPDAEYLVKETVQWQKEAGIYNGIYVLRSDGAAGELRKNSDWKMVESLLDQ